MSESDLTLAHTASPKWTSKIFPGMASIDNYRSIVPAEGMKWTYRSLDVSQTAPVTLNSHTRRLKTTRNEILYREQFDVSKWLHVPTAFPSAHQRTHSPEILLTAQLVEITLR